jgi:hypothetical protein
VQCHADASPSEPFVETNGSGIILHHVQHQAKTSLIGVRARRSYKLRAHGIPACRREDEQAAQDCDALYRVALVCPGLADAGDERGLALRSDAARTRIPTGVRLGSAERAALEWIVTAQLAEQRRAGS